MTFRKLSALVGLLLAGLFLCGFAGPAQGTEETTGTPWWVWVLIILALLFAAVLWWLWWNRRGEEEALPAPEPRRAPAVQMPDVKGPEVKLPEIQVPEVKLPEVVTRAAEVAPPEPDDLEIIEGIGPKIASLLKAAGITTFAQLADVDLERVQEILRAAHLRLADPTTWAEQARLAASGDWSALETLQNTLKGGRRG